MSETLSVYERVGDKFMKKIPHFPGGSIHALRMPLYADGKRVRVQFDRLDGSVLGAGAYGHAFAGEINCLVMETVHIETGACVLFQPAPSLDADLVADFTAAGRLLHMVQDLSGDQGHVLPDRAAAGYTQDLHSPANGKDRFPGHKDSLHKSDLKQVHSDIRLSIPFHRLFAKEKGGDVFPAAEKEAVT